MGSNLDKPIIGIDRGATFTDFAIVESGRLKETFSLENRGWEAISSAYAGLKTKYQDRPHRILGLRDRHAGRHPGARQRHC